MIPSTSVGIYLTDLSHITSLESLPNEVPENYNDIVLIISLLTAMLKDMHTR